MAEPLPAFSRGGASDSRQDSRQETMPAFTLQQLQAIVPQMAIVILQQQQTLGELVAQNQVTFKVPKAHPLIVNLIQCGKDYSEAVRNIWKITHMAL